MIDTRCHAHDSSRSGAQGRCQLAVGHEGPHAVMFSRDHVRMVRTWVLSNAVTGTVHVREHVAGQELRPWSRGLPAPAWDEATAIEHSASGAADNARSTGAARPAGISRPEGALVPAQHRQTFPSFNFARDDAPADDDRRPAAGRRSVVRRPRGLV